MIKTAVFVEGQTELIFVREMLLKIYQWQEIEIECFTLFRDNEQLSTEYDFKSPNPVAYFQINNVGNDFGLLSRIKNREKWIWNAGFHRIVGLRDMYSKSYREAAGRKLVNQKINEQFIEGHKTEINRFSKRSSDIYFNFAIMETETWILGFSGLFQKIHNDLDNKKIVEILGVDLTQIDPEIHFFHPAPEIDKIFQSVGASYDKKKGDVYSIVNHLTKGDFADLYYAPKCASFNTLVDSLVASSLL